MKYIDVKTVVESYKGFQDCMTNKSWGYLALLKGCNDFLKEVNEQEKKYVMALRDFLIL